MKISANVVTFNEEKNIERCLKSLSFCDEIVLVDSGSDDSTLKIARKFGAKIHIIKFEGFSQVKNYAIDRSKYDWVLSVDADEEITPELKEEILNAAKRADAADGYYIKRGNYFLGREIKHCGWDKDFQLRLFKRAKGRFNGKPVHESVEIKGSTAGLKCKMNHYSYQDSVSYFHKLNRYTTMQAAEKKKPFLLLRMLTAPFLKFFRMYFLKAGFLDGKQGFVLCVYSGFSEFVKFSKMRLDKKAAKKSSGIVLRAPNWIGDAVMMTSFLKELKKHYPKVVVAVTGGGVKSVLEGNPDIDRIIQYDRKSLISTLEAAHKVYEMKIDTGVTFSPSFSSSAFLWLAGLKSRCGYASDMGRLFLNRVYSPDKTHKREHVTDEYRKLLYLADNSLDFSDAKQELVPDPNCKLKIENSKFVLIAPFAKFGPSKMWPISNYAELMKGIFKKHKNVKVCVTGLEEDKSFDLGADVTGHRNFVDMRGTGLKEVVAAAKKARLFIGNDSGVMHIADAFGIPMVVIFGSTAPGWGGPVNSRAEIFYADLDCQPCFKKECRYGHYNCLKIIKPGDVLTKISRFV